MERNQKEEKKMLIKEIMDLLKETNDIELIKLIHILLLKSR